MLFKCKSPLARKCQHSRVSSVVSHSWSSVSVLAGSRAQPGEDAGGSTESPQQGPGPRCGHLPRSSPGTQSIIHMKGKSNSAPCVWASRSELDPQM